MKKYRIILSDEYKFEFQLPTWRNLVSVLSGLGFGLFSLLLLGAVVVDSLNGNNQRDYTTLIVLTLIAGITLLLISTLLGGFTMFVDPSAFIPILLFAFLSLLTFLITANSQNTFGPTAMRFVGGIILMSWVGLFYLANVFLDRAQRLTWWAYGIMGITFLAGLWFLFWGDYTLDSVQIIGLAAPVGLITFAYAKNILTKSAGLFIYILSNYLVVNGNNVAWLMTVNFVQILMLVIILAVNKFKIENPWTQLAQAWKRFNKGDLTLAEMITQMGGIILVIGTWITLLLSINFLYQLRFDFGAYINAIVNSYQSVFRVLPSTALLAGKGASTAWSGPTMSAIIFSQGFLGLIAYAFLWLLGIFLAIRNVMVEQSSKTPNVWAWILLPISLIIPLYSLVGGLSFSLMLWWWAVVYYFTAQSNLKAGRGHDYEFIQQSKLTERLFGSAWPQVRTVLIIIIVLVAIFISLKVPGLIASGIK